MQIITSFLVGLVFGIGLIVAGMANPAKVLAFLDLAGQWDPSLALVMAAAVGVGLVGFQTMGRRATSVLGYPMQLPATSGIDRRLVVGSVVFGVGWGIAGFCPGPALVALGTGAVKALVFVVAMLAGMEIFGLTERARARRTQVPRIAEQAD